MVAEPWSKLNAAERIERLIELQAFAADPRGHLARRREWEQMQLFVRLVAGRPVDWSEVRRSVRRAHKRAA